MMTWMRMGTRERSSTTVRASSARARAGARAGAVSAPRGAAVSRAFMALMVASVLSSSCCNGQNTTGTYVDVTPTVTSKVSGRFGTQPSARSGQTMIRVDDNTAVMFGGLTASGTTNDVWEYKVSTGNWTQLHAGGATPADSAVPTVPTPRVGHSAVILQGDLWVFGGYDSGGGDKNDVWHFSRSGGTWRLVPATAGDTVPSIRSGHSAVAHDPAGTKFAVFGGNMRNDMWEYDTSTGKWKMLMNEMATSAAARLGSLTRGGGGAAIVSLATAFAAVLAVL